MSLIQTIIIPRNWLFGRLTYILNNLNNIVAQNTKNFTVSELQDLKMAKHLITRVLENKTENSKILKKLNRKV